VSAFALTARQIAAQAVLAGLATWAMLFGGGRSGKTFLVLRAIILRALKAPGSRHLVVRHRFNHLKGSVILDTLPRVMSLCFPNVDYTLSKTDWYMTLPGGSEVWFAGLDDKHRTEKILGFEFATIYVNEASQVSWASVQVLLTRLAQRAVRVDGSLLPLRMWFDCNPPSKAHWSFKVFRQNVDPETGKPLPGERACVQMNPADNAANLSPGYLDSLKSLSARMQRRFVDGEFADATPNALFDEADIDRWRVLDGAVPEFTRVIVAVDPSGSGDTDNADNDAIGIVVAGLGTDGNAYLIEDLTLKAGPATWGRIAVQAWQRHSADAIVAEMNFGGDMVRATIQTAAKALNVRPAFKKVTASRGKVQRAEPFSALYEQGKVRHVGVFVELEDELCAFSSAGYTGATSPNRADAAIWALAELFPALVGQREKKTFELPEPAAHWMAA